MPVPTPPPTVTSSSTTNSHDDIKQFLLALLFQLTLPLLPLGIELWKTGKVADDSCTLVAALYAIAVGVSSTNVMLFGLSIIMSCILCVCYGSLLDNGTGFPHAGTAALVCIAVVYVYHALERFELHYRLKQPFFLFQTRP